MAKIRVIAMRDCWYGPPIQKYTDPTSGREKSIDLHKLYKPGDIFTIEEKDFSDYDKRVILYSQKVGPDGKKKIMDTTTGCMRRVDDQNRPIVPAQESEPLVVADASPSKEEI